MEEVKFTCRAHWIKPLRSGCFTSREVGEFIGTWLAALLIPGAFSINIQGLLTAIPPWILCHGTEIKQWQPADWNLCCPEGWLWDVYSSVDGVTPNNTTPPFSELLDRFIGLPWAVQLWDNEAELFLSEIDANLPTGGGAVFAEYSESSGKKTEMLGSWSTHLLWSANQAQQICSFMQTTCQSTGITGYCSSFLFLVLPSQMRSATRIWMSRCWTPEKIRAV